MRGIYTPVTDIRRKVFTEVARMAYEVDDMIDFDYLLGESDCFGAYPPGDGPFPAPD